MTFKKKAKLNRASGAYETDNKRCNIGVPEGEERGQNGNNNGGGIQIGKDWK